MKRINFFRCRNEMITASFLLQSILPGMPVDGGELPAVRLLNMAVSTADSSGGDYKFVFHTGKGMAIATGTISAWNGTSGIYTLYGLGVPGSENDTTGIYVNGVKSFTMKVIPRPLTCDTTIGIDRKVGDSYIFWVKPETTRTPRLRLTRQTARCCKRASLKMPIQTLKDGITAA